MTDNSKPSPDYFTIYAETALIIMEVQADEGAKGHRQPWDHYREENGSFAYWQAILAIAPVCSDLWRKLYPKHDVVFDWEYVPAFIAAIGPDWPDIPTDIEQRIIAHFEKNTPFHKEEITK